MKKKYFCLIIILLINCSSEEKRQTELKKLNSGTDSEKIESCNYFGKENPDKTVTNDIGLVIKTSENKKVVLSCVNALGYIGISGQPNISLKEKIMSENDSDIVHASLYSIYQIMIKQGIEITSRDAVRYSDVHHRQNIHIADLIDKINKYMNDKEK